MHLCTHGPLQCVRVCLCLCQFQLSVLTFTPPHHSTKYTLVVDLNNYNKIYINHLSPIYMLSIWKSASSQSVVILLNSIDLYTFDVLVKIDCFVIFPLANFSWNRNFYLNVNVLIFCILIISVVLGHIIPALFLHQKLHTYKTKCNNKTIPPWM